MIKYISCAIFKPYIDLLKKNIDIDYLDIEGHNHPKKLSKQIQDEIDKCLNYEKIVLIYGLCGNAILNILARDIPVYVVRVHDCLSVLLGSKDRFEQLFSNRLSSGWSCYSLEGRKRISFDNYDDEEREYLESILYPKKDIYITFNQEWEKQYENYYSEILLGDISFLRDIISCNSLELLELYKNEKLKFDEERILIKENG